MNEQNTQGVPPKAIGTGEGESPMTKFNPQNVTFRTQVSDIKSMQQSGGGRPEPYTLESKIKQEQAFQPPQIPIQPPRMEAQTPVASPTSEVPRSSKKVFIIVISLIVLAGLAFVGYAVVYPVFFEKSGEGTTEEAPVTPVSPQTSHDQTPTQSPEAQVGTEYVSVFTNAVQTLRNVSLGTVTYEEVMKGLGVDNSVLPEFRENIYSVSKASPSVSSLLSAVLPGVFSEGTLKAMGDYSVFSYVDKNGTWPGVVIRLSSEVEVSAFAVTFRSELERADSMVVSRFYTKSPGTPAGGWKQGQTQEVKNRYLVFGSGETAASFNYGWFGETLVLSTSYDGFKEALKYLR